MLVALTGALAMIDTYFRHLDLVAFLQMLSEYFDEIPSRDVFHSVSVSVNKRQVLLQTQGVG